MTFQILLSCMHQKDMSIFSKSHIPCDALAINQCDQEQVQESSNGPRWQLLSTVQRGISRSRNCAIKNAWADICLLADDDEEFHPEVEARVVEAFCQYPQADIIAFQVGSVTQLGDSIEGDTKNYSPNAYKCRWHHLLHICSVQIAFRRDRLLEKGILFDEEMGSGTGHGAQEENKFLFDCRRSELNIYYVPVLVANMRKQHDSQWFQGFDEKFFFNRGWATRRFLGYFLSVAYALFYVVKKYPLYRPYINPITALWSTLRGIHGKQ